MNEKIKSILKNGDRDIERKSVFWNMIFSIMSALQSAIMIMLVTRVSGTEVAGILSIAFAAAYLMYTVGGYGVRNFHSTDSRKVYSYRDYRKIRLASCTMMLICSMSYCFFKGYEGYKLAVVLLICILKLEEAVEDLYHGEFQRAGRLDIAGRLGAFRLGIGYIIFALVFMIKDDLVLAILSVLVISLIIIMYTRTMIKDYIVKSITRNDSGNFTRLLVACFPLFIMSFLSIYINNTPKYAIDACLSEGDQAYYAIISMPVFTINLLSGIIYRPKLLHMAELWNLGNNKGFKKLMWKQMGNVILISGAITVAGITVGIYLMEFLYGVSLVSLKKEFAILLLGGGVVATFNFLSACLTIVRKQFFMLIISVLVMALASVISNPIVQYAGLAGASYLYLILMASEMISIFAILCIYLYKRSGV